MEELIKIIGIGLIALVIVIILKQYRPEYAIYVSIIAGILILFLAMEKLSGIINLLKAISDKTYINKQFLGILQNLQLVFVPMREKKLLQAKLNLAVK